MSGTDKTLNSEKSFRVVVRLCAHENTYSHTVNRAEHSVCSDEPRASIKVTHLNTLVVDTGRSHKPYIIEFDTVLNEDASQRDVYESTTKSLVEHLMQGFNGCVIVYGSPGSGKTHTMQGCSVSAKHRGIISRAAEDIFTCIKPSGRCFCAISFSHRSTHMGIQYLACSPEYIAPNASHCKIRVSFYHVFNEKIFDLLDPKGNEVIWVRDCEEVVRLDGLTEVDVNSAHDLLQVHRRGSALRHTGISKGDFPSRSHTVFNILVVNTTIQSPEGVLTASKLTLVDLASSGKCRTSVVPDVKRTFNATNENPQEIKMLKRSLTIFGNVIFALGSAGFQHVPYRESKLTRALRDCLGGNCRTCLLVTVSSQSSSVSENLSSLQFASRAMAVPSRPIYRSQLHYTPEQVCAYLNGKKDINHLNRQQILPPVGSDRRSQTCLLPVLSSSASPSEPKLSSSHCADGLELKTFLPQLEKPGQTEAPGRYSRSSRAPGDEKNRADGSRMTRSLSRCLSSAILHDTSGRDRTGKTLEFSSAQRRSVERLSTSSLEPVSSPSAAVECPNCIRERKIREEYDKIIVQARRDKDSLSQKVAELEDELKKAMEKREEVTRWEKKRTKEESTNSTSADLKEATELCLQKEAVGLRAELSVCHERERKLNSDRDILTRDVQDLLTQINSTTETNSQIVSTLNNQRESLMAELKTSREELEKFRESATLIINQLTSEKTELMSRLENVQGSYEKVCLENADLRQKLKTFLQDINSAAFIGSSSPNTHSSQTVTGNTEVIVVSHHVSQKCPASVTQGSECCFSRCGGLQHPEEEFIEKSQTTNNNCELPLYKPQNLYKQLRREHSLLLDVMLVLYRREWFLQDAIPYVRRTLRKCGLRPEDID